MPTMRTVIMVVTMMFFAVSLSQLLSSIDIAVLVLASVLGTITANTRAIVRTHDCGLGARCTGAWCSHDRLQLIKLSSERPCSATWFSGTGGLSPVFYPSPISRSPDLVPRRLSFLLVGGECGALVPYSVDTAAESILHTS